MNYGHGLLLTRTRYLGFQLRFLRGATISECLIRLCGVLPPKHMVDGGPREPEAEMLAREAHACAAGQVEVRLRPGDRKTWEDRQGEDSALARFLECALAAQALYVAGLESSRGEGTPKALGGRPLGTRLSTNSSFFMGSHRF